MRHTVSLKQNHEFRSLYARGKNTAGVYLALYARKNRLGMTRLGITASSKLGNAVKRNRVRRLIREAYRLQEERFIKGYDLVFVARGRAVGAEFAALRDEMPRLGQKLGVCV
ncbi:MAG: ribonuclease P protein component [Oscillospiraceae bacterium]|jgi:ribonuclease P protein component|nr:ribonuclease P protein component [Oscillospiraceae bacterium]